MKINSVQMAHRMKLADASNKMPYATMSTNPVKVRATYKAATRDLMNYKHRIAYGEVDRLSCLFANMPFPYLN
jgi:hypothetical protein